MTVDRERLARPALEVARWLLGAVITSRVGSAVVSIRLTEVEAYEGSKDPASHAFRGRTPRTEVMFGPPGHLYCYFTYGMHWCANIVCEADGRASAVLLRGGEVIEGIEPARARRPAARRDVELARGPARLASCLALGRAENGTDLCAEDSVVQLVYLPPRRVAAQSGPRVGITQATEQPWRFWVPDDPTVSTFRAGGRRPSRAVGQTD
jgi:DNA-3-methyladenine glycosylase